MPHEHLILCGGATAPNGRGRQRLPPVVLDAPQPGGGNVHLRVDDITRAMGADLPDVVVDLVELATYVYCADQATSRGGKAEFEYGAHWRRRFHFRVPVRRPDVWRDAGVLAELTRMLSFLSDDEYAFEFVPRRSAPAFDQYLWGEAGPKRGDVDTVMMFSGGLDSLAGAVEEVFGGRRRVALVSHRPVSTIDKRQKDLVGQLGRHAGQRGLSRPFHVSVWANKDEYLGREYTQRTRSFLFGAMGLAVARSFGLDGVKFYENGVVSLNLPVCAQVLGGRASRTTHPQVLSRMQSLFTRVLERPFRIENPFLWKTKTDVTAGVRAAGLGELIGHTVSCAHTWEVTRTQPHCGKCSQCIDRRLAAVAAGLSEAEDPAGRYRTAVLTGTLDGVEHRTMVERVVGMAHHVGGMTNATQLFAAFGEAGRVLQHVGEPADAVAAKMFDLQSRHAGQVRRAMELAAVTTPAVDGTGECMLRIAAVPAAAPQEVSTSFAPTDLDVTILHELAAAVRTCRLVEISAWVKRSPKTVGLRINEMVRRRLVVRPHGEHKGATITPAGVALLARMDADAGSVAPQAGGAVRPPLADAG